MIFTLILILHVLVCLVLMATVLVQQGKGASMGAAFGTAGSQTIFGSSGAGNFLTKTTAVCAGIFFATSLLLAYRGSFNRSVIDLSAPDNGAPTEPAEPAKPAPEGSAPAPKAEMPAKVPAAPSTPSAPVQGAKPTAPAPAAAAPLPAPVPVAPAAPAPAPAAP